MKKVLIVLILIAIIYTTASVVLAYYIFKNPQHLFGLTEICEPDNKLGWSLKKQHYYSYILPTNNKLIEYQSNSIGCRVDTKYTDNKNTGGVYLFLGCSCTYGLNCNAFETYPEVVSKHFNKKCVNASIPGTGFAVMLERARELIPKMKPEYLFVQNSNWLMDRSSVAWAETFPWVLSVPYFVVRNQHTGHAYPLFNCLSP